VKEKRIDWMLALELGLLAIGVIGVAVFVGVMMAAL